MGIDDINLGTSKRPMLNGMHSKIKRIKSICGDEDEVVAIYDIFLNFEFLARKTQKRIGIRKPIINCLTELSFIFLYGTNHDITFSYNV